MEAAANPETGFGVGRKLLFVVTAAAAADDDDDLTSSNFLFRSISLNFKSEKFNELISQKLLNNDVTSRRLFSIMYFQGNLKIYLEQNILKSGSLRLLHSVRYS